MESEPSQLTRKHQRGERERAHTAAGRRLHRARLIFGGEEKGTCGGLWRAKERADVRCGLAMDGKRRRVDACVCLLTCVIRYWLDGSLSVSRAGVRFCSVPGQRRPAERQTPAEPPPMPPAGPSSRPKAASLCVHSIDRAAAKTPSGRWAGRPGAPLITRGAPRGQGAEGTHTRAPDRGGASRSPGGGASGFFAARVGAVIAT